MLCKNVMYSFQIFGKRQLSLLVELDMSVLVAIMGVIMAVMAITGAIMAITVIIIMNMKAIMGAMRAAIRIREVLILILLIHMGTQFLHSCRQVAQCGHARSKMGTLTSLGWGTSMCLFSRNSEMDVWVDIRITKLFV